MLSIILGLVIVGVVLYLVNTYIPMDERIKSLLNILIIIIVVVWVIAQLLRMFPGAAGTVNSMW